MQLEFFDVPSPCIGICQSDDKGFCMGCYRTRDERQTWINLSNDDKQKVIKRCQQRKKRKLTPTKTKSVEIQDDNKQASIFDPPSTKVDNSNDIDFGDFEL